MGDLPAPPELSDVLEYYGYMPHKMIVCPFHDESRASMSCNYEKNVYYCFACGAKGNSWTFIMEKEGVDFGGARRFAASKRFTEGVSDGSNNAVCGSAYAAGWSQRTLGLSAQPGSSRGDHSYKPSWRRG